VVKVNDGGDCGTRLGRCGDVALSYGYLTHTATAVVERNSSVVVMRARIRMLK
jgi:hypothetical protein